MSEQQLPGWLPVPVKGWIEANRDHPEHAANAPLIDRLAGAFPGLWQELQRRKPDGSWVYTVHVRALGRICDLSNSDPNERQEIALVWLFKQILHIAVTPHPARTEAEAIETIEDCHRRAKWLRTEADDTERLRPGAGGVDWRQVAAGMRAKADVLEQTAAEFRVFVAVVPKARSNLVGLQTASRISTILRELYGKEMRLQAATVATVLTDERVTEEQVRYINQRQPASVKFLTERAESSQTET